MDFLVVVIYLFFVFFLAFLSKKQESKTEMAVMDQYLAGKDISFIESMGSIIATEVSALTFIGIPAFSYTKDFSFLYIYIGALFGRIIIAYLMLPKMYDQGLTVYEIMSQHVPEGAKRTLVERLLSSIYSISKLMSVGVRLYSGSILVSTFFGLHIYLALFITTFITMIYTMIGGLKAVIRTDLLQTCLFVTGGIVAHYVITDVAQTPWSKLMDTAMKANKVQFWAAKNFYLAFVGMTGGLLFDLATHGVDQDYAQRLLACRNLKTAQRAIISSSFFSIAIGALFLGIGALLWSFYQAHPFPAGLKEDYVFAHFITEYFPTPLKGLMLAGVLAATMSTLDSTVNALSSCLWNDIFPNRPLAKIRYYLKQDAVIVSAALLLVAIVASKSSQVLVLGLKVASWSGGGLLAIFFSQLIFYKWIPVRLHYNILFSFAGNIAAVYSNVFIIKGPWQWNVYFGFLGGLLALYFYHFVLLRRSS